VVLHIVHFVGTNAAAADVVSAVEFEGRTLHGVPVVVEQGLVEGSDLVGGENVDESPGSAYAPSGWGWDSVALRPYSCE